MIADLFKPSSFLSFSGGSGAANKGWDNGVGNGGGEEEAGTERFAGMVELEDARVADGLGSELNGEEEALATFFRIGFEGMTVTGTVIGAGYCTSFLCENKHGFLEQLTRSGQGTSSKRPRRFDENIIDAKGNLDGLGQITRHASRPSLAPGGDTVSGF